MKYPLFDIHFHISSPRSLMPDAWFTAPTVQNAENLTRAVDLLSLSGACIPSITLYDPADLASNPLSLLAKALAPGKVWALCGLRWQRAWRESGDFAAQARKLMALGFDGVKLICKPNARRVLSLGIDDALLDGFFAAAEREGWPLLFHIGDPESFWHGDQTPQWAKDAGWYYGDDRALPPLSQLYAEMEAVLARFPRLRVTFAHFFFLSDDLERADRLLSAYPNVFLDVTPGSEMYLGFTRAWETARTFFEKHAGRILFGTDNESAPTDAFLTESMEKISKMRAFFETDEELTFSGLHVRGLGLSDRALSALYSGAAKRFLNAEHPRTVDFAGAAALCREYRAFAGDEPSGGVLAQLEERFLHL